MAISPSQFKETLSHWASGVTVVTTTAEGIWKGMTASSFTSLSAEPPLILVCLNRNLYTHQLLTESGVFAVNIMGTDQVELATRFAGMYPEIEDRFAGINCDTAETGSPVFLDALAWLDCKIISAYAEGDHTIFVGEVLASGFGTGMPLTYHNRHWGQFPLL
ncbi:flavin reductase family protein [Anaerolineales bacterium]